ncbi:MAG: radical SAM protein [bacterium]
MTITKIKIGLVEIGDSFGEQYYFPYSLGILRAYAEKKLASSGKCTFLPIIYKRGNIEKYCDRLSGADIIFFSAYLWNFKVSLEIARRVKGEKPEIMTVFGGPQIPESNERLSVFLRKYPFVDIAAFGEGETPFVRIIEKFRDREWDSVPSIGYRRPDTTIAFNEFKETIQDINDIPSPYLSGVFDELLMQNPEEKWQGKIETNRGCPFTCAFCYWGKKSEKKLKQFHLDRICREIDWLSKNKVEFVFCCDANFGILRRDVDIAKKVADNKKNSGYPKAFSVQNTKNSRERIFELQKILNDAGLQKGVNLALQSLNEDTLKYIERMNIDNKTYAELQKLFTESTIPTFTDLIIGLPGETYESFTSGVSEIIASGQHNRIQFINLTILENTLMAKPEFQQIHGLTTVETELTPHHSSPDMMGDIVETQHLVTATQSMPGRDWIKTKVFSWMASLLHFDKLLQIPFIVFHEICGIAYKDLIETFMKRVNGQNTLAHIVSVFEEKATGIQRGSSEYSMSREWLNIAWYPDELMLITMSAEAGGEDFYREAEERLLLSAGDYAEVIEPAVISQAVRLNRSVMKQPFLTEDISINSNYNIWEIYQAALRGEHATLEKGNFAYVIDRTTQHWTSWEEWCREVIWYGNKKGDYMYSVTRSV